MASLISANELLEIQVAFEDLAGTFLRTPITYHWVGQRVDRFMGDTFTEEVSNYDLLGLVVEDKTLGGAQIDISRVGKYYPKEYAVLLYWDDLVEKGLVDANNNLRIQANKDFLTISNVKYEVIGVVQIPDLVTLKSYVKVMFRKNITN